MLSKSSTNFSVFFGARVFYTIAIVPKDKFKVDVDICQNVAHKADIL